jgi:hypothetical protein
MYNFDTDIESESRKLEEKIKKLQEEKAELDKRLETEKDRLDLSRKVGLLVINEFGGKSFEYSELATLLDTHLVTDFDRNFFALSPLAETDPRRPKKRGRRKKAEMTAEEN